MKIISEYLDLTDNIGKTLYYPGAGNDFQTLKLFVENSSINDVYYSDYHSKKINIEVLMSILGDNWSLISKIDLTPMNFNKKEWSDFWFNLEKAAHYSKPENAYGIKFIFKHLSGKEFALYYLGTEAIKTYLILLENKINIDLVVLQDHGTGDNWSEFGIGQDIKDFGLSKVSDFLPSLLFVGKNTVPWNGYKQITGFHGDFGSAGHPRALFMKKL